MFSLYYSSVVTDLIIDITTYHPKTASSTGIHAPLTIKVLTAPTLKHKLTITIDRTVAELIFHLTPPQKCPIVSFRAYWVYPLALLTPLA